jgi:hypothetical protein
MHTAPRRTGKQVGLAALNLLFVLLILSAHRRSCAAMSSRLRAQFFRP